MAARGEENRETPDELRKGKGSGPSELMSERWGCPRARPFLECAHAASLSPGSGVYQLCCPQLRHTILFSQWL